MKQTLSNLALLCLICSNLPAQSIIDFEQLPVADTNTQSILTTQLLDRIDWQGIQAFCDTTDGPSARIRSEEQIKVYRYENYGGTSYFVIRSFNDHVLSFSCRGAIPFRTTLTSYFNSHVWLDYCHTVLPDLPENLKLSPETPQDLLIAYYHLLGVDTRDEYGWICEYSTLPMAPEQREEVIRLLHEKELLLKLLESPNVQAQLYAADALIFRDYVGKQQIEQSTDQADKDRLVSLLLTGEEWNNIYRLRDADKTVRTCGNAGSYRIYKSSTSELLSDKAIEEIPALYEYFSKLGYLKFDYEKLRE